MFVKANGGNLYFVEAGNTVELKAPNGAQGKPLLVYFGPKGFKKLY